MIPRSLSHEACDKLRQIGYSEADLAFFEDILGDYPDYRVSVGRKFAFRPTRTILIGPRETHWRSLFLHELSHAVCGHKDFRIDIERIKIESEAWEKAKEIAARYEITIDEDMIQDELNTYRDWLHQKSRCPICGLTRFQTPDAQYHCPRCENLA